MRYLNWHPPKNTVNCQFLWLIRTTFNKHCFEYITYLQKHCVYGQFAGPSDNVLNDHLISIV